MDTALRGVFEPLPQPKLVCLFRLGAGLYPFATFKVFPSVALAIEPFVAFKSTFRLVFRDACESPRRLREEATLLESLLTVLRALRAALGARLARLGRPLGLYLHP